MRRSYIYTRKEHTKKGIMATILGVIAALSIVITIVRSYFLAGNVPDNYGAAIFLAFIFAVVGVILAIISRYEKEKFYLFSYIGIGINLLVIIMVSLILYAGVYLS